MAKNYYKMNLEERQKFVEKEINKIIEKEGMKTLPVEFSSSMTRTLGMFRFRAFKTTKKLSNPIGFKISNKMLEEATLKSVKSVVVHEVAHYLAEYKYNDTEIKQGHNALFRKVCKLLECENDRAVYTNYTKK